MLIYALDFFIRFPRKDDSQIMELCIGTVNNGTSDKTADQIKATMEAAYRVLYRHAPLPRNIFGPMFPMSYLHVAVSSRVLHILSKVPEKVVENGWNKRKAWIEGSDRQVLMAYAEQADKDLVDFLAEPCRGILMP
ncbi:putative gibberellin A(9) O-methyltransferase [Arabidopsis thaliana]